MCCWRRRPDYYNAAALLNVEYMCFPNSCECVGKLDYATAADSPDDIAMTTMIGEGEAHVRQQKSLCSPTTIENNTAGHQDDATIDVCYNKKTKDYQRTPTQRRGERESREVETHLSHVLTHGT